MLTLSVELGGYFGKDAAQDATVMVSMVKGIAIVNANLLRRGLLPSLYTSHVRYVEDLPGQQKWRDCVSCYTRKAADCKSLAAWRLGEYMVEHELANVGVPFGLRLPLAVDVGYEWRVYQDEKTGLTWRAYHLYLVTPRGIEDPSELLGMR